ncbi:MAG: hypothetical protein A2Y17_02675 [Clostridiales bacterium GWF2_38_85]|nr:MAG: hypothetical protein A2Y17_02675 [Clostridiales bacterium GWF2_38_85]
MTILSCNGISLSYGTKNIINDISFSVEAGSKVGIIGVNGAGKTTLFRIINNELQPTLGNIYIKPNSTIGYLSQMLDSAIEGCTILEAAMFSFKELVDMERKLEELTVTMENGDSSVIPQYSALADSFAKNGGFEYKSKVKAYLQKLSFTEEQYCMSAALLSGGQKTRLMLAMLLLKEPDIIMLDEPTNHLDIHAIEWLEGIITASKKTFLIISHDRYFLDKVTDTTVEIENTKAISYLGNYSTFREKKLKLLDDYKKHYMLQQREIKRLEDFITNQRKWNRERNIIAAESRMKVIERMDKLDKPQAAPKTVSFKFSKPEIHSKDVLTVSRLSKSFPDKQLFSNISFIMNTNDRLFIIGKNGCGKSTLLKILTGRTNSDSGEYYFGYSQKIGFYDQETQNLDDENTVIEEIWTDHNSFSQTDIRKHLAKFNFIDEDIYKQVSLLSGGERARLSIAKLILEGASLLILDEPTNHFDISSKEVLESALTEFDGAILSVSHDRYFIKSLANRILEIDRDSISDGFCFFKGTYDEYLFYRLNVQIESVSEIATDKESKNEYLSEKQQRSNLKKQVKLRETLEKKVENLETRINDIKREIEQYSSDYKKLEELYNEEVDIRNNLDEIYAQLLDIYD